MIPVIIKAKISDPNQTSFRVTSESAFNYSGYATYDQLTALKLHDGKPRIASLCALHWMT